ncbi:unnamed protein product, partial [Mesorhabditis belari]|uniref:CID domain-containing protein n=1 Tax=Mesorhabditis belari TaxID=2138241 RepID=A0AAF3EVR2_9BILA
MAASEFREVLEELKENNKMRINLLTMLAEENQDEAPGIVDVIEQRIEQVSREQKLPILYVTDSILKNIKGDTYKKEFKRIILKCFVSTFKAGDEKIRGSMYNLRRTWGEIFPKSKLYELDMAVKEIDPAWPIAAGGGAQQAPAQPAQGAVHVNPRFIVPNSRPMPPQRQQRPPENAAPTSAIKRPTTSMPKTSAAASQKLPPKQPPPSNSTSKETSKPKSILKEVKTEPMEETASVFVDEPPVKRTRTPEVKKEPMDTSEPSRHRKRHFNENNDMGIQQRNSQSPPIIVPTVAPGAHAFAVPPQTLAQQMPQQAIFPSQQHQQGPPAFSHYMNMPPAGFPTGAQINTHPAQPSSTMAPARVPVQLKPPSEISQYPAPTPTPDPTASSSRQAPVIAHDVVKLEGVPANNRIFVEGKAHEVFYVENTAVIERNGLPHRIYFSGPAKNVIIDGVVHLLGFNETKAIFIDGEEHKIRFGAPSRELIMGDFPFKGAFGGAPIFATINGVRHEIRLSGPPPEVKIEPTPSYELSRFLPELRKAQPQQPEPKKEESVDPLAALLNSVKKTLLSSQAAKRLSPPIDSTPTLPPTAKGIERRKNPPSLKEINLQLLKVRYDSVITGIHQERECCPHCGMRKDVFKGDKYRKHQDWHIKRNLRLFNNVSKSRPWLIGLKAWTQDTGIEEDQEEEEEKTKIASQPKVQKMSTAETESRCCASCSLEFKRDFDEEEEKWTLLDCVMVNGKTYHQQCLLDASLTEPPSKTMIKEEPESDKSDIKIFKLDI